MRFVLLWGAIFSFFPLGAVEITSVKPAWVVPGAVVTLEGTGFGPKAKAIVFGKTRVTEVLLWSENAIRFRFPGSKPLTQPLEGTLLSTSFFVNAPPPGAQLVRVRVNARMAQQALENDPRNGLNGTPFLLSPLFDVLDDESGLRAPLWVQKNGVWEAELALDGTPDARSLRQLALVPLPQAGTEVRRAVAVLQEIWAEHDPWPLVASGPAWAWGDRDPRFDAKNQLLILEFPP